MKDKKIILFFLFGLFIGFASLIVLTRFIWHGKYYPGVSIASQTVAGLTRDQARTHLSTALSGYTATLHFNGATWQMPPEIVTVNMDETLKVAYRVGRRLDLKDYITLAMGREENFPLLVSINEEEFNKWVDDITQAVEIPPVFARVDIVKGLPTVTNGSDGVVVDWDSLRTAILSRASSLDPTGVEISTRSVHRQLSSSEIDTLKKRAEALFGDTLILIQDDEKITLRQDKLVGFLVDTTAVQTYVESLSTLLNTEPQDAKFSFENGRVKEFAPSKDGITVNVSDTSTALVRALDLLERDSKTETLDVIVTRTPPKITTQSVNNMGIVERIGRGESYYAHSIPNRVYNVGLAASRVTGALVPPGEEFSFNKFVGEISGATGYKTAYVISGGRTVLGDGGGVCQVSTTLFRAAMNAGLPITERWAHAYRVGYYEQNSDPGIDATVYSPSKDFKFRNDTPAHILVQAINDPKNMHLVFEIYGTKDGRVSSVSKPSVTGVSPPPPDIYEDDPNLPAGQLKQVDWAAWGAKTSFTYTVTKDGAPLFEKTYASNYRPWQNVYLRGTAGQPVAQ